MTQLKSAKILLMLNSLVFAVEIALLILTGINYHPAERSILGIIVTLIAAFLWYQCIFWILEISFPEEKEKT